MMKKNNRRVVLAVVLILVVCAATIGGTIAWLTDETDPVTNTFSPSDVDITLVETGTTENAKSYKMVPGTELGKDPKVTVLANSEACYLFVKVEKTNGFDDFMDYGIVAGWTELPGVNGVYYREVAASTADQPFDVLVGNKVTVKTGVTKDMMDELDAETKYPTMKFTAYAIQKDNIADVDAAAIALGLKTGA